MEPCCVMEQKGCKGENSDCNINTLRLYGFQLQLNLSINVTVNVFKGPMIDKTLHHCFRRSTREYFIIMDSVFIDSSK